MTVSGDCPHCGTRHVAFTIKGEMLISNQGESASYRDTLAECARCRRGILIMERGYLSRNRFDSFDVKIAPSLPDTNAPPDTPENVARFFEQAMENMPGNYDAAGAMFRKTLEAAMKEKFPQLVGSLNNRIKTAAKEGALTDDMAAWAKEANLFGNEAVHDADPFSKDYAEKMKDFTNLLLYYLFTLPSMLEQAKKRFEGDEIQE